MIKKRAPKISKPDDWRNHLNIGYAVENDEENPRQPAFSFVGATIPLLYDVFRQIAQEATCARASAWAMFAPASRAASIT